jgi:hypothetical protein
MRESLEEQKKFHLHVMLCLTAMSPERDQIPITIEEVISNAKEIMLRDGKHVPVLIMEVDNKIVAGQIPDMPVTHEARMELMHFLGQAVGKTGRVHGLQQVFMIQEGWMSVASQDKPPENRPSQDPNRKEVLVISAIQMKEHKKHIRVLEILRDSDEKVVGLEEFMPDEAKKDETIEVPLLDAFVHGFQFAYRARNN